MEIHEEEAFSIAACRGLDTNLFFLPYNLRAHEKRKHNNRAKDICARCPVEEFCYEYAIRNSIRDGVWGGATADERKAEEDRRERRRRARGPGLDAAALAR